MFAERGYHPTSVADIVAALGVGKGVFYWYFASKDELLTELLKASNHELRKRQQQAIEGEDDPVRRIELGIRATLVWFAEHREYFAIIQFAATDETFAPVLARNREISIADTIRHLKDGIVDGRIVDRDPELLAHAIHGVVAELTRHALVDGPSPSTKSPTSASPSASTASAANRQPANLRPNSRVPARESQVSHATRCAASGPANLVDEDVSAGPQIFVASGERPVAGGDDLVASTIVPQRAGTRRSVPACTGTRS